MESGIAVAPASFGRYGGVRAGDLLIATEPSARTVVVRCASSCTARYIAAGVGR